MSAGAPGGGWRQQVGSAGQRTGRSSLMMKRLAVVSLTVAIGAVIVLLVLSLVMNPVRKVRVVAIGMTYNHPAFPQRESAKRTAEYFETLHRQAPRTFAEPPDFREGHLDANAFLADLKASLETRPEKTLLVYCNALGRVVSSPEPAAQLLTVRSEGSDDQVVAVKDFFRIFKDLPAERVVVFLDGYQGVSNWRLGLFNHEFARQLSVECQEAVRENPKLNVICAASPGQMTWQSEYPSDGLFIFGKAVVEGLKGGADGMGLDARGEPKLKDHRENQRVSFLELVAYVKRAVEQWSSNNRASHQDVVHFGIDQTEQDFDIAEVPNSVVSNVTEKIEEKTSGAKTEPAANDKATPAGDAAKDAAAEKPKPEAGDGKAEAGAEKTADKKDAAAGADAAKGDEKPKSDSKPAEPAKGSEKEGAGGSSAPEFAAAKAKLWRLHSEVERLSQSAEALENLPRQWRRMNWWLRRAETSLRTGQSGPALADMTEAEKLLQMIEKARQSGFGERVDFSAVTLAGGKPTGPALEKEAVMLLDTAWVQMEKKSIEPALREGLIKLLASSPVALHDFYRRMLAAGTETKSANHAGYQKLRDAFDVLGTINRDRTEPLLLPAEILLLEHVVTLAVQEDFWPVEFARLPVRLMRARADLEAASLLSERHSELLASYLRQTELELVAAERWLDAALASEVAQGNCAGHVKQAEENLLALRKSILPLVAQAKILRNQLLAELPQLAMWIGRDLDREPSHVDTNVLDLLVQHYLKEVEREGPPQILPTPVDPGLKDRASTLLKLTEATRGLTRLLQERPANPTELAKFLDQKLRPQVALCQAPLAQLKQVVEVAVSQVAREPDAGERWDEFDAALAIDWLNVGTRQKLLSTLIAERRKGTILTKEIGRDLRRGEWQAFFSVQMLVLAEVPNAKLRDLWNDFAGYLEWRKKIASEASAERELVASLELMRLGQGIASGWRDQAVALANYRLDEADRGERLEDALQRQERILRCVHPADAIPEQAINPVRELERYEREKLIGWRAASWADRSRAAEHRDEFEMLAAAWSRLGSSTTKANRPESKAPRLADLEEALRFDKTRKAEFVVAISRGSALNVAAKGERYEDLQIEIFQGSVDLTNPGGQEIGSRIELQPDESSKVSLPLTAQLKSSVGLKPEKMVVALLDKKTRMPLDVRLIAINPPVDPTAWRFYLAREDELSKLNDRRVLAQIDDRNREKLARVQDDDARQYELWLPPNVPATKLKWLMKAPEGTAFKMADSIQILAAVSGKTELTVLAEAKNIEIPSVGGFIPLPFGAAAPADPAKAPPPPAGEAPMPPPAGEAPMPPPGPTGDKIDRLEVRLKLKGEENPVRHVITPRIRDVRTLIEQIDAQDVDFQNAKLALTVRRRNDLLDPCIPATFPVELRLPPALMELNPQRSLIEKAVGADNPVELSAAFTQEAFAGGKSDIHRIELDVAGVTSALAWNVANSRASSEVQEDLRLLQPQPRTTFKQGQVVSLQLGILSPRFGEQSDQRAWQIEWEVVSNNGRGARGVKQAVSINATHRHATYVKAEGPVWNFYTQTSPHEFRRETAGQVGAFTATARLIPPPGVTVPSNVALSKSVEYAVDSEANPPIVRFVGGAKTEEFLLNNKPLDFRVKVQDAESGIRRIAWGFDDNGNGQLELDKEEIEHRDLDDWPQADEKRDLEFDLQIPADRLPAQDGAKTLVVVVRDGLGTLCQEPQKRTFNFKLPPKSGTLNLIVENLTPLRATRIGRLVVQPAVTNQNPNAKTEEFTVPQQNGTATRKMTLAVGTYNVIRGNRIVRENVVVGDGKSVNVVLDASQSD